MRFYFNPSYYTFSPLSGWAFLERYPFWQKKAPQEQDGDLWVEAEDCKKIFSPEVKVFWDRERIALEQNGQVVCFVEAEKRWTVDGVPQNWKLFPQKSKDGWRLPLTEVLGKGFGYSVQQKEEFVRMGRPGTMEEIALHEAGYYRQVFRGKCVGELFFTIWNDAVKKLLPYRLYVPTYIQEAGKLPLVIGLHGGMGSPDSIFEKTEGCFSRYAEEMGFILMAPDGCIHNSTYGCPIPPEGCHSDTCGFVGDEQEAWEKQVSEEALYQEIVWVRGHWPVDEKRIYLMGNSMGGIGTFYFASRHPELFRGIAPAGAAPDSRLFDCTGLEGMPIYLIAGTEDFHGYDFIRHAYEVFREKGLSIQLYTVGGGTHSNAWIVALEKTLRSLLGTATCLEDPGR